MNQSVLGAREQLEANTKKELIEVLVANEQLHSAFFKYNSNEIEKNAKIMSEKVQKISDKKILSMLKFANTKLLELKSSNKKEDNNKNYHIVSTAMIYIMNKYDLGSQYNSYSCPMVKKKWIQNSSKNKEIMNPYAAYMPDCGQKDSSY